MHPLANVLKSLPVGDIVHDNYAVSSSVVAGCQGSEPLLARSVPNLKFYVLTVKLNGFNFEIDSNRVEKVLVE